MGEATDLKICCVLGTTWKPQQNHANFFLYICEVDSQLIKCSCVLFHFISRSIYEDYKDSFLHDGMPSLTKKLLSHRGNKAKCKAGEVIGSKLDSRWGLHNSVWFLE